MRIASDIGTPADPGIDDQKQAKLVNAAHQFEAMMLQEMLKPMQSGGDKWSGEDKDDGDSASDTIRSFGTEAFANAISKGGGFGIAKTIIAQVRAEQQRSEQHRSEQQRETEKKTDGS